MIACVCAANPSCLSVDSGAPLQPHSFPMATTSGTATIGTVVVGGGGVVVVVVMIVLAVEGVTGAVMLGTRAAGVGGED